MLPVLIPPERSEASVQRRYITSGKFEFCIDDGLRITLLTSDSNLWHTIEAGTRIVMRVVFERQAFFFATYECHLCGAQNELLSLRNSSGWLTDGSLDWLVLCFGCSDLSHMEKSWVQRKISDLDISRPEEARRE